MNVAVLIPAYNEAGTIRKIVEAALEQVQDVIVVDDGSTDATVDSLEGLPVHLIRNPENRGKAVSLWAGMCHACTLDIDAVITLDADGQHRPRDIPRFIRAAEKHPDKIIIGARLHDRSAFPAKRYYANKITSFCVSWIIGYTIDDTQSGFRLYPVSLLTALRAQPASDKSFVFETDILFRAKTLGYRCASIRIDAIYGTDLRPSHFRAGRDTLLITRYLLWQGLKRGLNPPGLLKATVHSLLAGSRFRDLNRSQWLTLILSNTLILTTASLSLLYLCLRCLRFARQSPPPIDRIDILLVLGMRLQHDGVGPGFKKRLDRACTLLRRHPALKVLVSGGTTSGTGPSEARGGMDYLVRQGIDPKRILLEEESQHTLDNIRHSRRVIKEAGYRRTAVLTNRYHLYRAAEQCKGFALDFVMYPAEEKFHYNRHNLLRILKEAWGVHWYLTHRYLGLLLRSKHLLRGIS